MISEKTKTKRKSGTAVGDVRKKTPAESHGDTAQQKKGNSQEKLKLRVGSGVVVLFRKSPDGLKSVAVVPVKAVSKKAF